MDGHEICQERFCSQKNGDNTFDSLIRYVKKVSLKYSVKDPNPTSRTAKKEE